MAGDFFDFIGELIRLGCGAVGHEAQNLFCDAGKLERLGAVDGVKEWVIAQAVVPDHGQTRLKTADAKVVGITETPQIAIQTEIDFGLPFQVRRDVVAVRPQAGALRVIFALEANEVIEADELFLRVDAPDARGVGCGFEVLQLGVKKEIVIQMVTLAGAQVVGESALVLHGLGEPGGDPVGEFQSLGQFGLVRFFPRGHFLQGHLFPDAFPHAGIVRRDIGETFQGNISLFCLIVMATQAVVIEEGPHLLLECIRRRV